MRGLGVGHPNDPIGGLNGGPLGAFHLGELPLGESQVVLHSMVGEQNL